MWEQVAAADEPADRASTPYGVNAEFGYGLSAFDGAGVVTPYTGLSLTDGDREWLAGTRFRIGALDADVSGGLARSASGESDYRVGIALSLPLGGGSAGVPGQPEEQQSRPMPTQPALWPGADAPAQPAPDMAASSAAAQAAPVSVARQPFGPPAPERVAAPAAESVAEPSSAPRWRVQLGAFSREANAVRAKTALETTLDDILVPARRALVVDGSHTDGLSRVVIADAFTGRATADALCAAIEARGPDCYVAPFRR